MKTLRIVSILAFGSATLLAQAAKKADPAPAAPKPAAPKPAAPAATPMAVTQRPPGLYGTMITNMGFITFQLFEKEAPVSVRSFVELCRGVKAWKDPKTGQLVRRPLIPGTTFHRVIPGFMIQAGDPTGTGAGEVGFSVPDEFNSDLKFDRPGRFGMANIGRPNTNSSQFFITEVPTPHLNGRHTIFGQVLEGQEIVNKIARVQKNADDKPVQPITIQIVRFTRSGPAPLNPPEGAPAPAKKAAPAPVKAATPAAPAKKAATPPPAPVKK